MALSEKSKACDALRRDLEDMLQQSLAANESAQKAADEAAKEIDRLEQEVCAASRPAGPEERWGSAATYFLRRRSRSSWIPW